MASQTETDVAATELELVEPALPQLMEVESSFYGNVKNKKVKVISYKEMRIPMKMWPGGKSGSFTPTSSGDLGRGTGPKYDEAVLTPVHTKHAIEWDLKSEWATDERRKAIVQSVRETVAEATDEYDRFLDCCVISGGGNGILGTISSAANNSPAGYDRYTMDSEYGADLLRYGHDVTIYQSGLSAVRHADVTEKSITNIDYASKTFDLATLGANIGQAGDVVVHSGLSGASPTSFKGVGYYASSASTGSMLGMDRAVYPQIRANSVNAAGSLALSHARLAQNKVKLRLGMNKFKGVVAWMHPCQKQAYEELGQVAQVINRSGGSPQPLDMYFDVQQIAGAKIMEHIHWSKKRIDFMDMSIWGRGQVAAVQWFKTEGRRVHNIYAASGGLAPVFGSYIVSAFNYFVENPGLLSYVYGLTVPSGY